MNKNRKLLNQAKHEANLAIWRERVRECRNSGLRIYEWCKQNGLNDKTYYKWQREIWDRENEKREIGLSKQEEIQFSEVQNIYLEPEKDKAGVTIEKSGWKIELQNDANPELVIRIIQTVAEYV
ncbi:MAG: hypothetical protein II969_08165 [Anaerolineaceae bacterium]|nr:hypothetical protein [Anaerolineaceae bacterium]